MFLSGAPHVAPTGPFSPRPVFFAEPRPALQSRLPGNDSFQLMSSSGFKALATLKESLFPDGKARPINPERLTTAIFPGAYGCSRLPTPAGFSHAMWGSACGPQMVPDPGPQNRGLGRGQRRALKTLTSARQQDPPMLPEACVTCMGAN